MKPDDSDTIAGGPGLARGRPTSSSNRKVADDIIKAALNCLETRSPQQLTVKEIATNAGTRPAMVNYYFGGLSGLIEEILRQSLREIAEEALCLRAAILRNEVANPLRTMIATFAKSYNQHPALTRILISEILREKSSIREYFVGQWPAHGKRIMEDILTHLTESGYYRKGIDVEGIGSMVRCVTFYPVIIQPYLAREGESIRNYLDDAWIDFVTEVFECYLKERPAIASKE